jgi:hypothetical protein
MEAGHKSTNYTDEEEHGKEKERYREKERERVFILDACMHT